MLRIIISWEFRERKQNKKANMSAALRELNWTILVEIVNQSAAIIIIIIRNIIISLSMLDGMVVVQFCLSSFCSYVSVLIAHSDTYRTGILCVEFPEKRPTYPKWLTALPINICETIPMEWLAESNVVCHWSLVITQNIQNIFSPFDPIPVAWLWRRRKKKTCDVRSLYVLFIRCKQLLLLFHTWIDSKREVLVRFVSCVLCDFGLI